MDCSTRVTKSTSYGDWSNIYLDRQNVSVPNVKTQAMTGFRLITDYKTKGYKYEIKFCKITG